MTGKIKKKVVDRKFGFIAPDDGSNDVFFHKDALSGVTFEELNEGDAVTYEVVPGKDGRSAAGNVTRA